ncbi:MAG: thioredoxin domain-containing protein [Reyranella sp.]|uniref:thioredoxin domain-containing protein n=1 Tax=Reyranella sp. TaxID=1929291 RepID=UPI001AC0604B|nr:thioredoxin domain-containing protein [Reyranella sp.]MBN9091344.1 thioredoxin domain-containing protein [Reyranella sp.]
MNRLAGETSPYLLQHAANPVHWWPWGGDALAEAQRTDRPILLSIGYAACHWCHVMAHESFESPEVAAVMNALFVNIKVDREERPDVDAIYMQALQIMGEQGGWPLTMFCTPRGEPFWGGTYFPTPARYGRPAFVDVLKGVAQTFRERPQDIETNRAGLLNGLRSRARNKAVEFQGDGPPVPLSLLDDVARRIVRECDMAWGGFGQAPKFPSPYVFELLWRASLRLEQDGALNDQVGDAVIVTLDRMCQGGIYDHLGGGFARYATDNEWLIPHFEKMLYDNAQLVDLLTLVWQSSQNPLYARRVIETCDWVLREMTADSGGFAASYDADSEGVEGKFYVWDAAEIDAILGPEDGPNFRTVYDVTLAGNWEHRNILHRNRAPAFPLEAEEDRLAALRAKVKAVRDKRVWPGWDDKVLADWNGLMIAALANAAVVFRRVEWLAAAIRAWRFIMDTMRDQDGRLFRSYRAGKRLHRGTLDDYANMARAGVALFEVTGEMRYLDEAQSLIAVLDRHFADAAGGYFTTADDAADLIVRGKHCHDNAVPAGNGTLIGVLARLWVLTGDERWHDKARRQFAAFAGELDSNFFPLMTLLNGYETLHSPVELVIVGDPNDPATEALRRAVYLLCLPNKVVRRLTPGADLPPNHPATGKGLVGGKPALYVCRDMACEAPITDVPEVAHAFR